MSNPTVFVHPTCDIEDLRISAGWKSRLNANERTVYETIAKVARGELTDTRFKSLAQSAHLSINAFRQGLDGLQAHGLVHF